MLPLRRQGKYTELYSMYESPQPLATTAETTQTAPLPACVSTSSSSASTLVPIDESITRIHISPSNAELLSRAGNAARAKRGIGTYPSLVYEESKTSGVWASLVDFFRGRRAGHVRRRHSA